MRFETRAESLAGSGAQMVPDVSTLIATADLSYELLLDTAATIVCGAMGDICVISLLSGDPRRLYPLGVHHRDPGIQRSLNRGRLLSWAPSGGISERVLATGEPAILSSIDLKEAEPGGIWHRAFDDAAIHSAAIVAMRVGGRRIGVVAAATQEGVPISADDVPPLQGVADLLALVVEGGHLREEVGRLRDPGRGALPDPRLGELTSRELEILALIGSGQTSREIGDRLYLSTRTIEWHRGRLSAKLGTKKRSELTAFGQRLIE